jgi:hypothetical protein
MAEELETKVGCPGKFKVKIQKSKFKTGDANGLKILQDFVENFMKNLGKLNLRK